MRPKKDGIAVTLDNRALKTPSGETLILPHKKRLAAALIANEWENQDKVLKPHALPMVCNAEHQFVEEQMLTSILKDWPC